MTRDELIALIRRCDPVAAAEALPPGGDVTVARGGRPAELLVDGDAERPIEEHRQAHLAGRPSEATLIYGEGVDPERIADRLIGLARLADETGLLRAVCPVPATGTLTPGSWGVEDLDDHRRGAARAWPLGAGTPELEPPRTPDLRRHPRVRRGRPRGPEGDPTDVGLLAEAVGRQAVER